LDILVQQVNNKTGKELPILIDVEMFKTENPDAPDLYETKIRFPPFPRRMTVAAALRVILDQIETKNATYVVLPGRVLVTTDVAASPLVKLGEKVRGVFEKQPLNSVTHELAEATGVTIIIDGRAGDKAHAVISATFGNDIDLAGALRVLAEMADLKVVLLDGTFYVTTPAHAEALRNEKRQHLANLKEMGLEVDPLWPYHAGDFIRRFRKMDEQAVAVRADHPSPERKLQEKVKGTYQKRALNAVLEELAQRSGATIIIDSRVGDKTKTEVSATFRDDVTLWGALRILTELADLRAVIVGGAVFVTTPERAEALREKGEK
jgi:type II secretory pathway component GspD/PulD (secretin)